MEHDERRDAHGKRDHMRDIEQVYSQIREICAEECAGRAVIFGSRARGTADNKSDIDLAVWNCPNFPRLKDRLDNELVKRLVATGIDRYIPEFERMRDHVAARYAGVL